MRVCWFATFRAATADDGALAAALAAVPGVGEALIHRPASTHDPYLHDGAPPALAIQAYFADIADLEAACAPGGGLAALVPLITGVEGAAQQAMLARAFPVPAHGPGAECCTYLVAYEGHADDLNAWLDHYLRGHPPIMAKFPGIRQIEICTRIDWINHLPWPVVAHMQRNKVVFDSPDALTAALNSPVRHEMREDFKHFPPFTGPVTHFPMRTRRVA